MSEKLERTLDEVESDLNQPAPEEGKTPKKVKKVAKKAKKVEKSGKAKKVSKSESSEGKVTLAELASEAGITTAGARRKLRAAELSREGRWAWEEGSKALKEAKKALDIED